MTTTIPLSEAKANLSGIARRIREHHERVALTRNGEAEIVMLSIDDFEGLEITLETLADTKSVTRIAESLADIDRGVHGVGISELRRDLERRRHAAA